MTMVDPFYPDHLDPHPPRWVHLAVLISALVWSVLIFACIGAMDRDIKGRNAAHPPVSNGVLR